MTVLEGIEGLRSLPPGSVISIGNYDGVHIGHQAIITRMLEMARGAPTAVVTFEPHPLTVIRPQIAPPRLSDRERKLELIAASGVDHLVILPPTPEVLNLTAEQFWAILRDDVKPTDIVEGRAFNFGKNRGGTIEKLQEWAASTAIRVHLVPSTTCVLCDRSDVDVSSSTIRWLLSYGRVTDAARCLGRPFELSGKVVQGFQRGRTIGVPTANLDCADHLVPAEGVYAGTCSLDGKTYRAAISIGVAPTFDQQRFQVEVFLLDFSGDLYGRTLRVTVDRWLRDQAKFPSIDALKAQISRDIERVGMVPLGQNEVCR